MTKKVKSSKKKFVPQIYMAPYMNIAYGLFANREDLDEVLVANNIPTYLFNTDAIPYAGTMRGVYDNNPDGITRRYAFVYAEKVFNDDTLDEPRRLSYIVHEAYHVVAHMIHEMGEVNPSEEFIAYTLNEVADNLFQEYYRWKEAHSG